MSTYADRLKALREQLKANQFDGFIVPLTVGNRTGPLERFNAYDDDG